MSEIDDLARHPARWRETFDRALAAPQGVEHLLERLSREDQSDPVILTRTAVLLRRLGRNDASLQLLQDVPHPLAAAQHALNVLSLDEPLTTQQKAENARVILASLNDAPPLGHDIVALEARARWEIARAVAYRRCGEDELAVRGLYAAAVLAELYDHHDFAQQARDEIEAMRPTGSSVAILTQSLKHSAHGPDRLRYQAAVTRLLDAAWGEDDLEALATAVRHLPEGHADAHAYRRFLSLNHAESVALEQAPQHPLEQLCLLIQETTSALYARDQLAATEQQRHTAAALALTLAPDAPAYLRARFLLVRARALDSAGQMAEALDLLEQCRAMLHPQAHLTRALSYAYAIETLVWNDPERHRDALDIALGHLESAFLLMTPAQLTRFGSAAAAHAPHALGYVNMRRPHPILADILSSGRVVQLSKAEGRRIKSPQQASDAISQRLRRKMTQGVTPKAALIREHTDWLARASKRLRPPRKLR